MGKTQKAKAKQTKGVLYIMGKTGKAGIILSMIAVQVLGTSAVFHGAGIYRRKLA